MIQGERTQRESGGLPELRDKAESLARSDG